MKNNPRKFPKNFSKKSQSFAKRPSSFSPRAPAGPARIPADFTHAARGIRLQKALAEAGVASRRDCEDLITQGRVTVNGQTVSGMPAWVNPRTDRIAVDGKPIRRIHQPQPQNIRHETAGASAAGDTSRGGGTSGGGGEGKVYVLLNKPRSVISTTSDPDHRRTVTDMVNLPPDLPRRLFPVGRLDAESNGLILLTNDGELANRITHPRYGVPKKYAVAIRGKLTPDDMAKLREGIHLAHMRHDRDTRPNVKIASVTRVELLGHAKDRNGNERTRLLVTLHEGQNREIRRMIAALGHKVRRLERVGIGPLTIKGLGVGQWRFLTPHEIRALQHATGQGNAPRKEGAWQGKIRIKKNFEDPLPPDIQATFDGNRP